MAPLAGLALFASPAWRKQKYLLEAAHEKRFY
jgi:hypothetical protein